MRCESGVKVGKEAGDGKAAGGAGGKEEDEVKTPKGKAVVGRPEPE